MEQPSPRSDHSTHPWLLHDQGLLPAMSLTSINETWRLELCRSGFVRADRYGSRTGLAGYPKYTAPTLLSNLLVPFSLSFSFFLVYHFIGLCRPPPPPPKKKKKSAAKSPSSFLLTGRWLRNTKKKKNPYKSRS